jgi:hypothetical protein
LVLTFSGFVAKPRKWIWKSALWAPFSAHLFNILSVHFRQFRDGTVMDKMLLDKVRPIHLLLGWHFRFLFPWLLTIAVVGLEHGVIHGNVKLKAIQIPTACRRAIELDGFSAI